ncbi:type 1 fimbrial protein [Neisseriaceae bacterium TC5R-5]|nr:type 1 fimbrial protein [Neisseriaceae bacterium TC5R-5]
MKKNLLSASLLLAVLWLSSAHANQLQIDFSGHAIEASCLTDDNDNNCHTRPSSTQSSSNIQTLTTTAKRQLSCTVENNSQIKLPLLSISSFSETQPEAGTTRFSVQIKHCQPGIQAVALQFTDTHDATSQTGYLHNQGTANNIQLKLRHLNGSPLWVGQTSSTLFVPVAADGSATLNYVVGYYATGPVAAGTVDAHAQFDLIFR